jgi:hypothetical protein
MSPSSGFVPESTESTDVSILGSVLSLAHRPENSVTGSPILQAN